MNAPRYPAYNTLTVLNQDFGEGDEAQNNKLKLIKFAAGLSRRRLPLRAQRWNSVGIIVRDRPNPDVEKQHPRK